MKTTLSPDKIESWVSQHFEYKKRGTELIIANPFHHNSKLKFNISLTKACCHDFRGDGWAGYTPNGSTAKKTFLKFVQLYLNCSYIHAVKKVLGSSSGHIFLKDQNLYRQEKDDRNSPLDLPIETENLKSSKHPKAANTILRWLNSRGIDKCKIDKYNIMHSGLDVVWPYFEFDELVYWQSRSRTDKRFLFPDISVGVGKGDFLYGFDHIEPAKHLIITEAIFDCQTLDDQCVASGGADLTDRQLRKIKLLGPKDGIILAPDNDIAGIKSILANASRLDAFGFKILFSIPPEIKYTDNYGETDVTKDWNDLVTKIDSIDPLKIMEENIRFLGVHERYKLRTIISAGVSR